MLRVEITEILVLSVLSFRENVILSIEWAYLRWIEIQ